MENFRKKYLLPGRKWSDILPVAWLLCFLLISLGQVLGLVIIYVTRFESFFGKVMQNHDAAVFLGQYASFIGIWIVVVAVLAIFPANRPLLPKLGPSMRGNTALWALTGGLIGFGMNGFCILMSSLMGDIQLSFSEFRPVSALLFLIAVCIQSGAEELATRFYLYEKLRRRYRHPAVAIIGNAALFGVLHLGNSDISILAIAEIVLIGITLSLLIYYFDSFWAAVMVHTAWNYTQSIIFGLPNSGVVSAYSVFRLDAASARNGLFYDVGFGVEGSLGSVLVIAVTCVVIFVLGRRRKMEEADTVTSAFEA